MAYKVVISDETAPLLTLETEKRTLARAVAEIAKENGFDCVVTVPEVKAERTVKFAGID